MGSAEIVSFTEQSVKLTSRFSKRFSFKKSTDKSTLSLMASPSTTTNDTTTTQPTSTVIENDQTAGNIIGGDGHTSDQQLSSVKLRKSNSMTTSSIQRQQRSISVPPPQTKSLQQNQLQLQQQLQPQKSSTPISRKVSVTTTSDCSSSHESNILRRHHGGNGGDGGGGDGTTTLKPSSSSTSLSKKQRRPKSFITTDDCTSTLHDGRELINAILPVNIDTLFDTLHSKSKFLDNFHEYRKIIDTQHEDWKIGDDGRKCRKVKCTMPIKQKIGPTHSHVIEEQVLNDCSIIGHLYSVDVLSWNEGVPYGDSFEMYRHHCLVKTHDDHTHLTVYMKIKFIKPIFSMIKNLIEKTTWNGVSELHADLLVNLQRHFCAPLENENESISVEGSEDSSSSYSSSSETESENEDDKGSVNMSNNESFKSTTSLNNNNTVINKNRHIIDNTNTNNNNLSKKLLSEQSLPSSPIRQRPTIIITGSKSEKFQKPLFKWFMIFLLFSTTILNGILIYKLFNLNKNTLDQELDFRFINTTNLTQDDWLRIFQNQEIQHQNRMRKIQDAVSVSMELLRKTEKNLGDLMTFIRLKERT